jgi:hypothetical protein
MKYWKNTAHSLGTMEKENNSTVKPITALLYIPPPSHCTYESLDTEIQYIISEEIPQ